MAEEKELSVSEVAKRLNVPERRIQESLHHGRAPRAYKAGRLWKIPESDLPYLQDRKPGRPWHRTVLHQINKPSVKREMLTTKEAAAILGVNIARMKVLVRKLPNAYKEGMDWRIPPADLELIKDRRPGRPWPKNQPEK